MQITFLKRWAANVTADPPEPDLGRGCNWKPEMEVNLGLAEHLIESQFPKLAPVSLQWVGSGWENVVYRVNREWFFRFPQRQGAAEGVRNEITCLPALALRIRGVVNPQLQGRPCPDYPWPFFGFRPIEGVEASCMDLNLPQRERLAPSLAHFLRQLHSSEISKRIGPLLPMDPFGRLDFSTQGTREIRERFDRCKATYDSQLPIDPRSFERILSAAGAEAHLPASVVAHGDLQSQHVLLSPNGLLSGVIDWGHLQRNDPAVDLQIAWSFFHPEARELFWAEYGPVSKQQLSQSRAVALFLGLGLFEYSAKEQLPALQREACRSIQFLLQD